MIKEFDKVTKYKSSDINNILEELAISINSKNWWKSLKPLCEIGEKSPLYICILDGAVQFYTDVVGKLQPGYCVYLKADSYGDAKEIFKDKQVKIPYMSKLPDINCISEIFIFDDICDSGRTLKAVVDLIKSTYAKDTPDMQITTVVLIDRIRDDKVITPTYFGIKTDEPTFFAGYGLDDRGYGRNIPCIYDCAEV